MQPNKNSLLSVKDVMHRLNVSRRTIYYWIEDGLLKPIRLGGVYRFHPDDIEVLIESQRGQTAPKRIRILSIDDDFLIRESLKNLLKQYECDAVCVTNVEEALEALQREHFDVVITDLKMPKINGIEVLKKIRELREKMNQPPLPEMMLTAYDEAWAVEEAKKMGIKSFMHKPFDLPEFITEIKRIAKKE